MGVMTIFCYIHFFIFFPTFSLHNLQIFYHFFLLNILYWKHQHIRLFLMIVFRISSPPESPQFDVICVTWSPSPIDSQNGKVKGYKEKCIASYEMSEKDAQVQESTNQYLTVEDLLKYNNDSVWVLAFAKTKHFSARHVKIVVLLIRSCFESELINFLFCS